MRPLKSSAFTLVELLIVVAVIALLTGMLLPAVSRAKQQAKLARCSANLRQLGLAVRMYLDDSGGRCWRYFDDVASGRYWYFGYEPNFGTGVPEGQRELDVTKAKLYPYFRTVGGIEICPSFEYGVTWYKPKFKGASYGYGMNYLLSGTHESKWTHKPSQILWFVDAAQINNFQAPASPTNPLVEEFYYVDASSKLVHFRHGGRSNALFCDGRVEAVSMHPGTLDTRLPNARIGRINPTGDTSLFQ